MFSCRAFVRAAGSLVLLIQDKGMFTSGPTEPTMMAGSYGTCCCFDCGKGNARV